MAASGNLNPLAGGATPGSIQSIRMVCVNVNTISSTSFDMAELPRSAGLAIDQPPAVRLPTLFYRRAQA